MLLIEDELLTFALPRPSKKIPQSTIILLNQLSLIYRFFAVFSGCFSNEKTTEI